MWTFFRSRGKSLPEGFSPASGPVSNAMTWEELSGPSDGPFTHHADVFAALECYSCGGSMEGGSGGRCVTCWQLGRYFGGGTT